MPARRLTQWVPRFRAPAPSQWRSPLLPGVVRFSSSNAPSGKSRRRGPAASTAASPSIFDQLFPPESVPPASSSSSSRVPGPTDGELLNERIPIARDAWSGDVGLGGEVDAAAPEWRTEGEPADGTVGSREEAVLVVRNGSRSTLPSDFYRVAPKGAHLDGRAWSSMQAMQARHPETMEPMDKYLLHFASPDEAIAYKAELERLVANPSAEESRLTLCAPDPASLSVELVRGADPVGQIPGARVPQDVLRRGLDARNIVHVKLDGSQLMPGELSELVVADGRSRNLAWKLARSWGRGGIAVNLRGSPPRKKVIPPELPPEGDSPVGGPLTEGSERDTAAWVPEYKTHPEEFFSRFFLAFHTVQDARRFIRSWHRRTFKVNEDGSRACIINASLIW